MYKKTLTHYIAKITIDVLFFLSIICVILIPFYSKNIFTLIGYPAPEYFTTLALVLFFSGLCCVYILMNLRQMYRSLLEGNPFVDKSVCHLRRISVACVIISVIYIIKSFFMFTFGSVIIALVFIIGCLFCLTLKDLFKQAINFKSENDLTI